MAQQTEQATFGAGCFWCVEAIFERLKGVSEVEAGYSGGAVKNPSYKEVCRGTTGHAEVARITFNPEVISFETLAEVFFYTHDPTTLNQQGNDVGTQYRSAIFYHTEQQKQVAEKVKEKVEAEGYYSDPVVTEISPLENYYPAENYHQDYFKSNPNQGYCAAVIRPKLQKFMQQYSDLLKE
ncbi:MAG: peptide-methionine (S)-S-oxide reductase MsrA [Chitinophagales bacterium]